MALFGRDLRRMNSIMSSGSGHHHTQHGEGHSDGTDPISDRKLFGRKGQVLYENVLCSEPLYFVHLEKDNEIETRVKVGDARKVTLDELYNITGTFIIRCWKRRCITKLHQDKL
ncbi:unnamed protein product [Lepeophtheirus salmonis]|uniref:(salmon louse) hypothetical protein n=1 Tax=Lepeophtheirus salmonis TaxID=72036 RepID=A0A7R8CTX5_LEPSM|nr:unnamed protein product [Lepeophtheirus salmonis]CAF2929596.1 unnamed protein product [Lepeophtheirus salmonis]